MPTLIDSLVVALKLDSADFESNRKKVDAGVKETAAVTEASGKKLDKAGKDTSAGFEKAARTAASFLAVVGGTTAIKRFVEHAIESNAALNMLATNLGLGVNNVSAWSQAAEQAGGTAGGLQQTMDMLSMSQTDLALTGQSSLIPYLSALGVSLSDTSGKARPVNDLLLDLSDKFSRMDRTTAHNMGRMMGIDSGTMQLLLKGRSEVELMIKRQQQYGAVTQEQAEQAAKMNRIVVESRQKFEAFGRELLTAAMPAIEAVISGLSSLGDWMRDNKEFVSAFLTILAAGLAAVALATMPINLTVVAVTALGAAIAALYQDYQTWKKGGETFIDWGKWEPGFKAAGNGIRWLRDLIVDLVFRASSAADVLAAVFNQDWEAAKKSAAEFWEGNGKTYGAEEPEKPVTQPKPSTSKTTEKPLPAGASDQYAIEYFRRQGWSQEQAAGIAANLKHESGFKTGAVGDSGKAYGIAQWHPDRQENFRKRFGKDIRQSTLDEQLAFVQYELTGPERAAGNKLREARTASDAAAAVSKYYERPADREGEARKRGATATALIRGVPNASQAATGAGAAPIAESRAPAPAPAAGNRSVETHIGEVRVYTAATDAQGISKDMGKGLDYLFTSQANRGLD